MRSGINMDVTAKLMLDDPAYDVIYFFADEARNLLAATVKREEVAGIDRRWRDAQVFHGFPGARMISFPDEKSRNLARLL
jgi:hypothetical protein